MLSEVGSNFLFLKERNGDKNPIPPYILGMKMRQQFPRFFDGGIGTVGC